MKTYRNIYMRFVNDPNFFTGETEIHYTGDLFFETPKPPEEFDSEQDAFYGCCCELKNVKGFVKV